jgi:hypothetical protein
MDSQRGPPPQPPWPPVAGQAPPKARRPPRSTSASARCARGKSSSARPGEPTRRHADAAHAMPQCHDDACRDLQIIVHSSRCITVSPGRYL